MGKNLLFITILLLFGVLLNRVNAQTTQASISGTVTDDQKKPIPGVSIQIKNSATGFTSKTVTNNRGEYTFKELPLGGPYVVKANFVGFNEQIREGFMLNQGDGVQVDVNMHESSQNLAEVTVSGNSLKNKIENIGAATAVSAKAIYQLPVNGRNFTTLVDLSPLSRGGNISGQLASSTNYTIDGMNAKNPTSAGSTTSRSGAPYSISIEAVREFKVVTNQYDVTYGRSGGGTVSAVTKSGTNTLSGSAFTYGRADWLSSGYDIRGNRRNVDFSTYQYGFSLGGPIIKDKLHFFVAWDHQRDVRPLLIADIQSPADELRYNLNQSTLDKVVNIAREKYGLASSQQYGSFPKKRGSDAGFLRLDWQIDEKNLLTIRDNYTNDRNRLGLEDNSKINLYESYGNDKNVDNSLLATLRTAINPKFTNELKLQHLYTYQKSSPNDQLPAANIPRVIVEGVTSVIGGKNLATDIQFGGHRFAQEGFTNNVLQLVDNLYYNTDKVKYTFGIDLMYTNAKSLYGSEVNGRFHVQAGTVDVVTSAPGVTPVVVTKVPNFDNLENGTAYRFFREVPLVADPSVRANIFNAGIYGQMQTKLALGLDLTAGVRLDYAHYPTSPLNQLVFDELGIRTDNKLKSFVVQPRFQLTWDVNEKKTDFIRLGAGIFASDINNYVTINNLTFDGKHYGTVDLRGNTVPTAYLTGYRNDPSTTPTLSQNQLATINTYAKDAKVPVVYKSNLSYSHFFSPQLRVGLAGFVTLGRNNYVYVDRNMVSQPFFTLPNEGNRGVYVPPISIVASNGATDWQLGRISNKIGRVLEMNSNGKVNQFAIVADATWQYYKDGEITLSYTYNDTKDNTSYNGNVANTATLSLPVRQDPRDLSQLTYSDNQFRNKVVFYGTSPSFYGFNIGVRYSGIGGTRYSLLSGANTNGDFVATNDLAFVFDRNNPNVPANVRNGLQAILDNPLASQSLKDYINKYSGQIAQRNGGINGFYGVIDLRIIKTFHIYKKQVLELSVDAFNVANIFKKTWGVNESLSTQALYALQNPAFDINTPKFNYNVNNAGIVNPSGNPYQFQVGLRYGF